MASNKRAAMRRELKAREKLNKGPVTTEKLMARAFVAGKNEGIELATAIMSLALHEEYGFGNNRLQKLYERIGKESLKMDELPTQFNVDYYIAKLRDEVGVSIIKENENDKTFKVDK